MAYDPSYDQIHIWCLGLVNEIKADEQGLTHVLGISSGGLIPGVIIAKMLNLPFIPINCYVGDGAGDNKFNYSNLPKLPEFGRVLIVDDVVDSGKTMKAVLEHYKLHDPVFATLYYKFFGNSMFESVHPVYYAESIMAYIENPWITFPWEVK